MTIPSKPISALGPTMAHIEMDPDDPRALVGQVIAERYAVEALLGVGGMGSVYRARHIKIKKQVALKTLHSSLLRSSEAIARFEREAVAAARISHPNVVVATDFGPLPDGRFYLVLEYVEGRDLAQIIAESGPLALPRVLNLTRQIASALDAAHRLSIVHRDLKPDNVMIVSRGLDEHAKVLDFGIAKVTLDDNREQLTQFGAVFGTPQYMSPEQAKGQSVDGRSDLYSLGVVIFEMLTGKLPFEAADALGYLMQHLNAEPAQLPLTVPAALRQLVSRLLAKDPSLRPQTALDVLTELDRLAALSTSHSLTNEANRSAHASIQTRLLPLLRSLGGFLGEPRRIARYTLKTYVWLTLGAVPALGGFLLVNRCETEPVSSAHSPLPSNDAPAPSSSLPSMSETAFATEVARIEAIKVYERTELDWTIFARGTAKLKRWEESALAYQAILSLRRDLRNDPGLLTDLLDASEDPKAFRIVLNLAETVLGKHGIDLIWSLWDENRLNPERKEQAEKLAKKLVILSRRASPALRTAIELNFTNSCEKILDTLKRATTDADSRSVERLTALTENSGCGANRDEDCFPCLRNDPTLAQALERAKQTLAPRLGETKED